MISEDFENNEKLDIKRQVFFSFFLYFLPKNSFFSPKHHSFPQNIIYFPQLRELNHKASGEKYTPV